MPLTNNGFQRITYDEILTLQSERAKTLFGDDIDTSDQSIFGKMLRLYCMDASENQELAEGVYLSAFPNTSYGVGLDRLCPFVGITRNPATYAQHEIVISGTIGAVISAGFVVSSGDVVFHTIVDYTIGSGGTAAATVECNVAGDVGNVAVGSITSIVNPNADVTGISHTAITVIAEDAETDYELRQRFSQSLSGSGSGTVESIRGALLRISGVESVLIIENTASTTNAAGVPPHSFRCYVLAPNTTRQLIGQTIFDKKPIGIGSDGAESVTVVDSGGGEHAIKFSWTTQVNIYVRCTVSKDSGYTDASTQQIKENIVEKLSKYVNSQDVTATSLYSAVYVDGVTDVTSLTISSNGSTFSTAAIQIDDNQVARSTTSSIEVTVNA